MRQRVEVETARRHRCVRAGGEQVERAGGDGRRDGFPGVEKGEETGQFASGATGGRPRVLGSAVVADHVEERGLHEPEAVSHRAHRVQSAEVGQRVRGEVVAHRRDQQARVLDGDGAGAEEVEEAGVGDLVGGGDGQGRGQVELAGLCLLQDLEEE